MTTDRVRALVRDLEGVFREHGAGPQGRNRQAPGQGVFPLRP